MKELWRKMQGSVDTVRLLTLMDRLWQAIATEDPELLASLVVSGKQLDLVWDLWGWPGVRLVTSWTPDISAREIAFDGTIDGTRTLTVNWGDESDVYRGVSLWFDDRPDDPRILDATPSALRGQAHEPYEMAMQNGLTPPWRGPAPDPVEAKLRQAVAARKYPMDQQTSIINMWRRHASLVDIGQARPEAWAAAVELGFWNAQDRGRTPAELAAMYGARKGDVKRCFEGFLAAHP